MMNNKLEFFRPDRKTSCKLPFFSTQVCAGFPSPAEDYIEQTLDLNELLIQHPAATFFVRVQGDSMLGAHIYCGDILIVDRAIEPKDGQIVIAVVSGEFTVKRIRLRGDSLYLLPENSKFPPIKVTNLNDFQVWGVVTFVIQKLEKQHRIK